MKHRESYSERIQHVVEHLAEHLEDEFDLERLAQLAHLSPYHFHRIYRAILGETVYETTRRLRLNRAALDLLDDKLSIERTAHRAGFGSQAAFTRAFRAEYGTPPARYRDGHAAHGDGDEELAEYEVDIVDLPDLRVASIEHRGDYQLTGKAFERLMTIAATTGLLTPETRSIGIYYDDPTVVPTPELRSTACVTVPADWIPSHNLLEGRIEGGRYARVVHVGPYSELATPYDWLYRRWLPRSGEDLRNLPCLEEYLNDPRQVQPKDLETAVMMPLEG